LIREPLAEHTVLQVRASQAGILRVHDRQVGLPNRQPREVHSTQIAARQPEQIDDVAWPVALFGCRAGTPLIKQGKQQRLNVSFGVLLGQPPQDRRAYQAFLRLANIVSRLRLDERLGMQHHGSSATDLVCNSFDQTICQILEHHGLHGEGRNTFATLH
jgi:hypothetical protein